MRIAWYALALVCGLAGAGYVYLIAAQDLSPSDIPPFLAAMAGAVIFWYLAQASSPGRAVARTGSKYPKSAAIPDQKTLFIHVFHQTVGSIHAFTSDDRANMLLLLKNEGFNKPDVLFDPFFASREWLWPEFESWANRFSVENSYPESWQGFLASGGPGMVRRRHVFNVLMQTIAQRTDNLLTRRHARSLGAPEELIFDPPTHAHYARQMAVQNPEAVPPFFPGDNSSLRIKG